MTKNEVIIARINELLDESQEFWSSDAQKSPGRYSSSAYGWISAARHVIELACPSSQNAYRKTVDEICKRVSDAPRLATGSARIVAHTLKRLLQDVDSGLLASIANEVTAENFDIFLDHGADYLKRGAKNEAGVIVGIVFEDTIRRISRNQGIKEHGRKLDTLISDLDKKDVITGLKAKRCRAAAGLRTSAAHARWDDFVLEDVRPVLELTRELLVEHLAS